MAEGHPLPNKELLLVKDTNSFSVCLSLQLLHFSFIYYTLDKIRITPYMFV
jgi:hypothetical protein